MTNIKLEIVEVMDNIIKKIENKKRVNFNKNPNIKTYLVDNISYKTSNQLRNIQKKRSEKKRKELYYAKLELNRLLNLKKNRC
tara:strand:+ start:1501 stop:1749 length:249 start_codon:yes stop_codon:yes gene_type:complete